jgi:hypothetical protein
MSPNRAAPDPSVAVCRATSPFEWGGRRKLLAVPALLLASPANAQLKKPPATTPSQWYVVKVEDNAFTVEMPGIPDHHVINDKSARGTPFALHSYSLDIGGYSYVVQTALFPEDVDTAQPRRLVQAAVADRAQALASRKWDSEQWRETAGGAAVETVGTLKNGNRLRQLILLKDRRFVSLAFMGAAVDSMEANRFIRSLKLA